MRLCYANYSQLLSEFFSQRAAWWATIFSKTYFLRTKDRSEISEFEGNEWSRNTHNHVNNEQQNARKGRNAMEVVDKRNNYCFLLTAMVAFNSAQFQLRAPSSKL